MDGKGMEMSKESVNCLLRQAAFTQTYGLTELRNVLTAPSVTVSSLYRLKTHPKAGVLLHFI